MELDPKQIELPSQWKTEVTSYNHHNAMKYISPRKTIHHTTTKVKDTLAKRKMHFCFHKSLQSSSNELGDNDPDFQPDQLQKRQKMVRNEPSQELMKVECKFCVCKSLQINRLIEDIKKTSFYTPGEVVCYMSC